MSETADRPVARGAYDIVLPAGSADENVERLRGLARSLLEKNAQLERALESRVVIEQAKGVLAERLGIDVEEAFEVLRYAARSDHLRLHGLARSVVASRETPPAVTRWLARRDVAGPPARASWTRAER